MAELKNLKLTAVDGSGIDDAALSADFRAADKIGPFMIGRTGFYYRDGLKKIHVPLSILDNAFTRVQEVDTHCCCCGMTMFIYRLVLCSGGKELVDIRTEDEKLVDRAQALLAERVPGIKIGYTKPAADGEKEAG